MSKKDFKKNFEWVGSTVYIRVNGKNTSTELNELFEWYETNQYELGEMGRLKDELHTLWDKHNRLLQYLGLEDVTMPQRKEIRKLKSIKATDLDSDVKSRAKTGLKGELAKVAPTSEGK